MKHTFHFFIASLLLVLAVAAAPPPVRDLEIAAFREKIGNPVAAMIRYRRVLAADTVNKLQRATATLGLIRCLKANDQTADARTLFIQYANLLAADPDGLKALTEQLIPDNQTDPLITYKMDRGDDDIHEKLENIIIPKISFEDAPFPTAVDLLRRRSRQLDPDQIGINIILIQAQKPVAQRTVTMDFDNLPVGEAIRYICNSASLSYRIDNHAVVITDDPTTCFGMDTRIYPISPDFFDAPLDQLPQKSTNPTRDFFEQFGVDFPGKATAIHLKNSGRLLATNTPENLNRIETMIGSGRTYNISQLRINTEWVELPIGATLELPDATNDIWSQRQGANWQTRQRASMICLNGTVASYEQQAATNSSLTLKPLIRPDGFTIVLDLYWRHATKELKSKCLAYDGKTISVALSDEDPARGIGQRLLLITATMIDPHGQPIRKIKH